VKPLDSLRSLGAGWERWIERHLSALEGSGHAGKTISERRRMLEAFGSWAEEDQVTSPQRLTSALVRAYGAFRRALPNVRGRLDRVRTVNTHLLAVRRFLDYLARERVVPAELPRAVEYIKTPQTLPRCVPSHVEVLRMMAAADETTPLGLRDRAILELFYSTGIRRDELLRLAIADVDTAGGYVRIERGKGGKGRVVPLGRSAAGWIDRYLLVSRPILTAGSAPQDVLFVSKSGACLDPGSLRRVVVAAARRAGLAGTISPHALRRACATEMIRRSANLYHVKEILGHEDLESLKAYVRMTSVDLKEAHRQFHPREQGDQPS
jgi:integrase/recombinase XerD